MHVSIASPLMQPSPNGRRVGIRIVTFEAFSGFTHVTARWIAQPPKATFVTRLQPFRLPDRAARQLPDQSTIIWVESSSTDSSRLRGARPLSDIGECLNGENFYSLKEGRAKILGFLLPAGQATLRSLFGGVMGDVRLGWSGGSRHSSPPAST